MTLDSTKCGHRQMAPSRLTTSREDAVEAVDEEVEVKEVKVKVVKAVKVVEITIIVVGVKTIKTITVVKEIIATLEEVDILDIKLNVILTNLHLNHVFAIGLMENLLIFAWSQVPAPGRSSGPPSPTTNDGPASPETMTLLRKIRIICIRHKRQK